MTEAAFTRPSRVDPETGDVPFTDFLQRELADIGTNISGLWRDQSEVDQILADRAAAWSPYVESNPIEAAAAEFGPGMATMAIGGGQRYLGQLGTNMAMGGLEGALTREPGQGYAEAFAAGAGSAFAADTFFRTLGRVFNAGQGLALDMLGQSRATPPPGSSAERWRNAGGRLAGYQYLEEGSDAYALGERLSQGAAASVNPGRATADVLEANNQFLSETISRAAGNPTDGPLRGRWFSETLERLQGGFQEVAARVQAGGDQLELPENARRWLSRNSDVRNLAEAEDMFNGLEDGLIRSDEWLEARQILADQAADTTDSTTAGKLYQALEGMDDAAGRQLGDLDPQFTQDYARLREQYRVFMQLERPNVVNRQSGFVNLQSLDRNLRSKTSGFGRAASATDAARPVTNQETAQLLEIVDAASEGAFRPFRSSGTAENLALSGAATDAAAAGISMAATGDLRPALGFAGRLMAPRVVDVANRGQGALFTGLTTPAGPVAQGASRFMGRTPGFGYTRAFLDELFQPMIGSEDDRER